MLARVRRTAPVVSFNEHKYCDIELPRSINHTKAQAIVARMCPECKVFVEELIDGYEHKLYILRSGHATSAHEAPELCERFEYAIRQKDQEIRYLQKELENAKEPDKKLLEDLAFYKRKLVEEHTNFSEQQHNLIEQYEGEMKEIREALSRKMAECDTLGNKCSELHHEVDSLSITRSDQLKEVANALLAKEEAESQSLELEVAINELQEVINSEITSENQLNEAKKIFKDYSEMNERLQELSTQLNDEEVRRIALQNSLELANNLNQELREANESLRDTAMFVRNQTLEEKIQPLDISQKQSCEENASDLRHFDIQTAEFVYDFSVESSPNSELDRFVHENPLPEHEINFELLENIPKFCFSQIFREIRSDLLKRETLLELGVPGVAVDALDNVSRHVQRAVLSFLSGVPETPYFVDLRSFEPYINTECKEELVNIVTSGYELVEQGGILYFVKGNEEKAI